MSRKTQGLGSLCGKFSLTRRLAFAIRARERHHDALVLLHGELAGRDGDAVALELDLGVAHLLTQHGAVLERAALDRVHVQQISRRVESRWRHDLDEADVLLEAGGEGQGEQECEPCSDRTADALTLPWRVD